MQVILLSVNPEQMADLLNGDQTIIIRKTMPKCDLPIKVCVYCTKSAKSYLYRRQFPIKGKTFFTGGPMEPFCLDLNGKVVASFILRKAESVYWMSDLTWNPNIDSDYILATDSLSRYALEYRSCITRDELEDYIGLDFDKYGYAWYVSDLVIFDEPKELSNFGVIVETIHYRAHQTIKRPPQSWRYVEELA